MRNLLLSMTILMGTASCTYTVSMAHTQGTAENVADDTSTASPNVSPNIDIPVTPGAGLGLPK